MTKKPSESSQSEPMVVRISGPQGLVAAVPPTLGFHPQDSLVLLCINGPRQRIGPVVRTDLEQAATTAGVRSIVLHATQYADQVALICYHDGPRPGCLDTVADALSLRGVPVMALLSVKDGRIRDAWSARRMRHDTGIPVLDPDDGEGLALSSAYAMAGRVPLADRAELARSLRPAPSTTDGAAPSAMSAALDAAYSAISPGTDPAEVDKAWAHARRCYESAATVPGEEAARLITLTSLVACRDRLLGLVIAADDDVTVPTLLAVSRQCPDASCANLCAVLAAAAYHAGDGALAHCALDRVDDVDPEHRLAGLLRTLVDACVHPSSLDSLSSLGKESQHGDPESGDVSSSAA